MEEEEFKVRCIRSDGSSDKNGASKAMFDAYSVSIMPWLELFKSHFLKTYYYIPSLFFRIDNG